MNFFLLAFVTIAIAQISFTKHPMPLQLYPRNSADSAVVAVAGVVTGSANDSLTVKAWKGDSLFYSVTQPLVFTGDSAKFEFLPKIHAELVEYSFKVFLDTQEILNVDSVVCGDAFLITGQSNANVTGVNISSKITNEWLRSFGSMLRDSVPFLADTSWGRAHGSSTSHWRIGASWLRLGMDLIAENKIPICMLNGAWGGTIISEHLPGITDSRFSPSLYSRLLYRAEKAGISGRVKAMFWHQGESDDAQWSRTIPDYVNRFDTLYRAWKADYQIQKCYVYQIRPRLQIPEAHRQIAPLYSDVTLLSTSGNAPMQKDGTHFTLEGYYKLMDWTYPIVNRDIYNHPDSLPFITPPAIKRAFFTSRSKDEIILEFDQPVNWMDDTTVIVGTDTIQAFLKDYFSLDTSHGMVDTGYALPDINCIVLKLKQASTATTISYINKRYYLPWAHINLTDSYNKYSYQGPWLLNERRMGILVFTKFPLTTDSLFTACELKQPNSSIVPYLHLYNNGAGRLSFVVDMTTFSEAVLTLSDIQGRKVYSQNSRGVNRFWRGQIASEHIATGVYFAQVRFYNGMVLSQKVVIVR